jgi:hypothetical protein
MASRAKNNTKATNPQEGRKSSLLQLVADHKVADSVFHIKIANSPSNPYLTFRNYATVEEARVASAKADLFIESFDVFVKKDPSLEEYRTLDRETKKTAWLLGFLSQDYDAADFFYIAKETPMLFMDIATKVDEACFGNENALYVGEIAKAKKD